MKWPAKRAYRNTNERPRPAWLTASGCEVGKGVSARKGGDRLWFGANARYTYLLGKLTTASGFEGTRRMQAHALSEALLYVCTCGLAVGVGLPDSR